MIIIYILVFFLILSTIIIIHEFGHFFFAKRAGILCHEFSLGMGPALWQKKKGETTYSIRLFPIGGFVSMAGETPTDDIIKIDQEIGLNLSSGCVKEILLNEKAIGDVNGKVVSRELYGAHGEALEIVLNVNGTTKTYPVLKDASYVDDNGTIQIAPYDRCFESKTLWQRFLTIFAGPFMNMILAIVICIICGLITGVPNKKSTVIGEISDNYPASEILQKNDQIISVNGYKVNTWTEFSDKMSELKDDGIVESTLVVKRDDAEITLPTITNFIAINSIGLSNFTIKDDYKDYAYSSGVMVGVVALNYKNEPSDKAPELSNGDIIKSINIVNHGSKYNESNWINVNSWSEIVNLFKDVDVANVYFRFYDQQTSTGVDDLVDTYSQGFAVESYGNEVLDNQRIEKISIKIGISPVYRFSFIGGLKSAFKTFWDDFTLIFNTLKLLIAPSGVRQVGVGNLSGVVGIFGMVKSYFNAGIIALLLFMALLSVNIGVVNLLPIPALDGGRIFFLGCEAVTRKKLNPKVEAILNNVMFILIMILFVYITYNDIVRLMK